MKYIKFLSISLLYLTCASLIAINTTSYMKIRPSFQDLVITNRTSGTLTIEIQSSYAVSTKKSAALPQNSYSTSINAEREMDKKIFVLAPGEQNKFSYRVIKTVNGKKISYQGGLDIMCVYFNDNLPIIYHAVVEEDGLQHFQGERLPDSSYNLLSINETPAESDTKIYLSYDPIKISMNNVGTKVEYNNTTGGYNRY